MIKARTCSGRNIGTQADFVLDIRSPSKSFMPAIEEYLRQPFDIVQLYIGAKGELMAAEGEVGLGNIAETLGFDAVCFYDLLTGIDVGTVIFRVAVKRKQRVIAVMIKP